MLNEIIEYEELLNLNEIYEEFRKNPESKRPRLNCESLKDGFSGANRVYVTVARHFFFDKKMKDKELEEKVNCTIQALYSYNGFAYCLNCDNAESCEVKKEIDGIFGILPRYILKYLRDDSNEPDKCKELDKYIEMLTSMDKLISANALKKEELTNGSILLPKVAKGEKNAGEFDFIDESMRKNRLYKAFKSQYHEAFSFYSFPALKTNENTASNNKQKGNYDNRVYAERAVSNAIALGELKKRYLVAKNADGARELLRIPKSDKEPFRINEKKDKVLKMASAILLSKTEGQDSSFVVDKEVDNWFSEGKIKDNRTIKKYFEKHKPFGVTEMSKYTPKEKVKDADYEIFDTVTAYNNQKNGIVIFEDNGTDFMSVILPEND